MTGFSIVVVLTTLSLLFAFAGAFARRPELSLIGLVLAVCSFMVGIGNLFFNSSSPASLLR